MQRSTVTHAGVRTSAGRHRASERPRRHRGPFAVGAVASVCVLAAVGWFAVARPEPAPASDPVVAATPCAPEASAWIRANVPTSSKLLTDGCAPPPGYPTSAITRAQDWRDFDYLLTTHTGAPEGDAVASPVLTSSLAVAVFDGVQVRRIVASEPGDPPPSRDADLDARLRAGRDLLRNPLITVSAIAQPVISRGELDLRAAAVLSALAGQLNVTLQDVTSVAAEAAAGVPARAVTIYTTDPARTLRMLAAFDPALRPGQTSTRENGAIALLWNLSTAPTPTVR